MFELNLEHSGGGGGGRREGGEVVSGKATGGSGRAGGECGETVGKDRGLPFHLLESEYEARVGQNLPMTSLNTKDAREACSVPMSDWEWVRKERW